MPMIAVRPAPPAPGSQPSHTLAPLLHPSQANAIGKLTTHVLDTARGRPAGGLVVTLARLLPDRDETLAVVTLDDDGRAAAPFLEGAALTAGRYRLSFAVADYFRAHGVPLADPPFLDRVPIEFGIADADAAYHVPLLVSPWAYSTYHGS